MKMKLYQTFPVVVLMSFLLPACKSDQVTLHVKHVILIELDGVDSYDFKRASLFPSLIRPKLFFKLCPVIWMVMTISIQWK